MPKAKTVTVSVIITEILNARVEAEAARREQTRSHFIRQAIKNELERIRHDDQLRQEIATGLADLDHREELRALIRSELASMGAASAAPTDSEACEADQEAEETQES